jgi:hypothetical protein
MMGPGEVALMQYRADNGIEPTNTSAYALFSGLGVGKKKYTTPRGAWWPEIGERVKQLLGFCHI